MTCPYPRVNCPEFDSEECSGCAFVGEEGAGCLCAYRPIREAERAVLEAADIPALANPLIYSDDRGRYLNNAHDGEVDRELAVLPDEYGLPVRLTAGELRRIRAALAALKEARGDA